MLDTTFIIQGSASTLYNDARKWFSLGALFTAPVLLFIDAPFGRFTPKNQSSMFLLDGRKSWIIMELVSPIMFIYTFVTAPLTPNALPLPGLMEPQAILAVCFLVHYLNRAIVSPLRTPSRSKSHITVPLWGVAFNVLNGSLMGSYLSSPYARMLQSSLSRPSFYVGLAVWCAGMFGNVYHDEILLNIRRNATAKGKAKEGKPEGEHYAIPQGGLYSLISYPNYLCEWIEWLGYAIAAAPLSVHLNSAGIVSILTLLNPQVYIDMVKTPSQSFAPSLSPPWIFLLTEFLLMVPRAYKGHKWYHSKFKDTYPKERKAVIPFIL